MVPIERDRAALGRTEISIWFFNGVLLAIYGAMIGGYGLYELISGTTPPVVLAKLHAPLWWGGGLLLIGLGYCMKFSPRKREIQKFVPKEK